MKAVDYIVAVWGTLLLAAGGYSMVYDARWWVTGTCFVGGIIMLSDATREREADV